MFLQYSERVFIIDSANRDELINKDPKSAEIKRPILRGRDIKRYGYEFADKYLIALFPSRYYDIGDYPAIKEYLISAEWSDEVPNGHGKDKLEQTGAKHTINGTTFTARKKTNNKWFETQDQIAYWDDFSKQKIIYREISTEMNACLIRESILANNKCYLITGEHLEYLLAFLNSKLFNYIVLSETNTTGGKGPAFLLSKKVIFPSKTVEQALMCLLSSLPHNKCGDNYTSSEKEIDIFFYNLYNLNKEEIDIIEG